MANMTEELMKMNEELEALDAHIAELRRRREKLRQQIFATRYRGREQRP